MKKIHGKYSIQPLTITDEVVADDAAIKEHKIDFLIRPSELASRLTELEARVTVTETDIAALKGRVSSVESSVTTLNSWVNTNSDIVQWITEEKDSYIQFKSDVTTSINNLESSISSLNTYIDGLKGDIEALSAYLKDMPSFIVCPEYPNGVLTSLGNSNIMGLMTTDYDPIVDKTFFEWSSTEDMFHYYGIVFKHWMPKTPVGKKLVFKDAKFYAKLIGESEINFKVYDATNTLIVEKIFGTFDSDWSTITFNSTDLSSMNAVGLDWEYVRCEVCLSARNSGKALISDFAVKAEFEPE